VCGEEKGYRVLVRKPEGERQFRRPRDRWEDNIKINFKERGGRMRTDSGQGYLRAFMNAIMNLRVS
jgi:hypothetical protein